MARLLSVIAHRLTSAPTMLRHRRYWKVLGGIIATYVLLVVLLSGGRKTMPHHPIVAAQAVLGKGKEVISPDRLKVHRDLYRHEKWPGVQNNSSLEPNQMPGTVHYVWCGEKEFRFQHYLGLLSVIRLLQPLKIVFHYTHLPVVDSFWYHTWFTELKQSFANLEMQKMETVHQCGSRQLLVSALDFMQHHGGVYIGENVILTRFPTSVAHKPFWFAASDRVAPDTTQGVVVVKEGFGLAKKAEYSQALMWANGDCTSVKKYEEGQNRGSPCIIAVENIFPRDIWSTDTPFGELARWLFYGKRGVMHAQTTQKTIPRIAHITWLTPEGAVESNDFHFMHFMSVISALYVAGLRHVYVHGQLEPKGQWWAALKSENVSFVKSDTNKYVFQQLVKQVNHRSDIARTHILNKYGGVYQDLDTIWIDYIPEWLLHYQTVACPDWPQYGDWPEAFNTGILMSQAHAPWLRHFLSTFRYFRSDRLDFNALLTPYRLYEMHPEDLYVDRHLQVICFRGICHPVWHEDYLRDIDDRRPVEFNGEGARAIHFTEPKAPPSIASPSAIKTAMLSGTPDIYARFGHLILTKSGRGSIMDEADAQLI